MTENKRYFKRMWEEEYYIFDSQQISEKDFDEKVEYEDYQAFADSMTGEEVTDRLNKYNKEYLDCHNDVLRLEKENEQLKQSYKEFEDECQSTFNAMSRKQNDLYRKNFKLKEENEQLEQQLKDYIKDITIEVKELPEKGDSRLIYVVNGLEYIYFKGQWECIGKE